MKYLSICSGIESAGLGWHPLGFECVGLTEIDDFRSAVLQYHFPNVKNYGDFTKLKPSDISDRPICIVGGTPCATFSIAGLRKGLAEDRGNLALEFIKCVDRFSPKWVVWENVPGVLSSNEGKDLGTFLGALADIGYGFAYRVLDTQYIRTQRFPRALPQRRRRIFVVGCLGDWKSAAKVLFDTKTLSGYPPPRREKAKGTAKKTTHRLTRSDSYVEDDIAGTIAARDYKSATDLVEDKKDLTIIHGNHSRVNGDGFKKYGATYTSTASEIPSVLCFEQRSKDGGAPRIHDKGHAPTLNAMTGGNRQPCVMVEMKEKTSNDNGLIHCGDEIKEVTVRKHDVRVAELVKLLRDAKNEKNITNKEISNKLDVPITQVEHWFRTDKSFSIPPADIWEDVKKILGITITDFDAEVCEFITKEGVFEMSKRVYDTAGTHPTLVAGNDLPNLIGMDKVERQPVLRRLTPLECERLQGLPDNWTQVPYRGKPKEEAPVSRRYEACGRAMSVNVMEWLGTRLMKVEKGEL